MILSKDYKNSRVKMKKIIIMSEECRKIRCFVVKCSMEERMIRTSVKNEGETTQKLNQNGLKIWI